MQEVDTQETCFFFSAALWEDSFLALGKKSCLFLFMPPVLVKHKSTLGILNTINIRYKNKKCYCFKAVLRQVNHGHCLHCLLKANAPLEFISTLRIRFIPILMAAWLLHGIFAVCQIIGTFNFSILLSCHGCFSGFAAEWCSQITAQLAGYRQCLISASAAPQGSGQIHGGQPLSWGHCWYPPGTGAGTPRNAAPRLCRSRVPALGPASEMLTDTGLPSPQIKPADFLSCRAGVVIQTLCHGKLIVYNPSKATQTGTRDLWAINW